MSKRKPIKIIKVVLSENGKTLMIYAKKGSNFLYAKVDSLGNITEIGKTIDNGDFYPYSTIPQDLKEEFLSVFDNDEIVESVAVNHEWNFKN